MIADDRRLQTVRYSMEQTSTIQGSWSLWKQTFVCDPGIVIADERQAGDILSPTIVCDRLRAYGNQCFAIVRLKLIVVSYLAGFAVYKVCGQFRSLSLAIARAPFLSYGNTVLAVICEFLRSCDHLRSYGNQVVEVEIGLWTRQHEFSTKIFNFFFMFNWFAIFIV